MSKPTRYLTKDEIEKVEVMAGVGLNLDQISAILGISDTTLDRRIVDQPEVKEALLKGRSRASYKVMQTAFTMATSGKQPAMTMFWLKCREHWKDRTDIVVNSPDVMDSSKTDELNRQLEAIINAKSKKTETK